MRVCMHNGRIVEGQSFAPDETLITNNAARYPAGELVVVEMPDAEFFEKLKAQEGESLPTV